MTCKELCIQHKAKKKGTLSRYGNGQKRCQICDIFMNWMGDLLSLLWVQIANKTKKAKIQGKTCFTIISDYTLDKIKFLALSLKYL